jgi:CarD family transcriptional regulator
LATKTVTKKNSKRPGKKPAAKTATRKTLKPLARAAAAKPLKKIAPAKTAAKKPAAKPAKRPTKPVKAVAKPARAGSKPALKAAPVRKPAAKPATKSARSVAKPVAKIVQLRPVGRKASGAAKPTPAVAPKVAVAVAAKPAIAPAASAAPPRPVSNVVPMKPPSPMMGPPKQLIHVAPPAEKPPFTAGDFVVYPTHGVGKILGVEEQEIAGYKLSVFVVHFDKDRMTLRVPLGKAKASGLRKLSSRKEMDAALAKLRGRSRVKRTMWSRRAQEYEAKINSGDPASIAEVVRDLYRNVGQPEQSYSERQIYQAALDRLVREFAAVEKIDEETATKRIEQVLNAA